MFDLLWSNGKGHEDDNFEGNITNYVTKTNVRRVNNANHNRGLSLLIENKPEDYFITNNDYIGVKLLVHDPSAYPELQSKEE